MMIFFIVVICFVILGITIYIASLSKDDNEFMVLGCIGIIIVLTITLTSKIDNEIKKKDIVNILNGNVKYDTISMDKYGKLLEIEIIK